MNSDLSSKTIMIHDYGLFASWALKLRQDFGRVLYYCPFKSGFPKSQQYAIGTGLEGVERVADFWDHLKEVDIFMFPDVYDGDLQEHLRSLGYPVWGSAKGEELELYRWQTKLMLKKDMGLPVQPVERIIGVEALREYLKENENKYVKISMLRGDFETFHHIDYALSEPLLDEVEARIGPYKFFKEFIIEDAIDDAVEVGYDGWTIDGLFPSKALFGYEVKDVSYIGTVRDYNRLPIQVKEVNMRLSPLFATYNYRGFWSSEIRVPEDGRPYLTDPCCRAGSPPSELYQEMYRNWGEIIWFGAHGQVVEPRPTGRYGVEVLLHSQWADSHWQALYFPPELRSHVKLRNLCQVEDTWYVAPQSVGLPEIGAVVAVDDTLIGAVKKAKAYCEQISGYSVDLPIKTLLDGVDQIRLGEAQGMKFSDDPLPTAAQLTHALSS